MANVIHLKALAKINLGLDVIGVREDGYHLVRMVMQTIDLYDWVTVRKAAHKDITLATNLNFLPADHHNIAYQAAELLKKDYHRSRAWMCASTSVFRSRRAWRAAARMPQPCYTGSISCGSSAYRFSG